MITLQTLWKVFANSRNNEPTAGRVVSASLLFFLGKELRCYLVTKAGTELVFCNGHI